MNTGLRSTLHRSLDLADLGEALALAGSEIASAGNGVIALNEPPTEMIMAQARASVGRAWRIIQTLESFR